MTRTLTILKKLRPFQSSLSLFQKTSSPNKINFYKERCMKKSLIFLGLFGVVFLQNKLEAVPQMCEAGLRIETPAQKKLYEEMFEVQDTLNDKIVGAVTSQDITQAKDFFVKNFKLFKAGWSYLNTFEIYFFSTLFSQTWTRHGKLDIVSTSQALKLVELAEKSGVIVPASLNLADFILSVGYTYDTKKLFTFMEQFIACGAKVNCFSSSSESSFYTVPPLVAAIWVSQTPAALIAMVDFLLKHHANPNLKTSYGATALDEIQRTLRQNILIKQSAVWRDALGKVVKMLKAAGGQ